MTLLYRETLQRELMTQTSLQHRVKCGHISTFTPDVVAHFCSHMTQ